MNQPKVEEVRHGEPASGYAASALIFAAMTALWAFVVKEDPYYRLAPVLGVRVPVTLLAFLVAMPLAGFLIGFWRYDRRHHGGAFSFAGKLIARGVHFTYAHLLLVMFTVAMTTDYFLGLNLDDQVRAIDDRSFDIAARFAPWLAAYLAGFNFGRAARIRRDFKSLASTLSGETIPSFGDGEAAPAPAEEKPLRKMKAKKEKPQRAEKKSDRKSEKKARIEPPIAFGEPSDLAFQGDLSKPEPALTSSGLPQAPALVAAPEEPGFLPPQDFSKLRPGLRELR